MNELTIITKNSSHYLDSREVAGIIGKNHKDLLRDIRNYIQILDKSTERNFAPSDFFLENTYKDGTGRVLPCYMLTKKACELVAHKLTGEKGVLFTAAYINCFHAMEERERMAIAAPKIPRLSDYNNAAQIVVGALKSANVPIDKIAVTVKEIYELSGIKVSLDGMVTKRMYTASEIAVICGMISESGRPHCLAVSALISQLDFDVEKHVMFMPYFQGNGIRISIRYDEYIINKVREWLDWHDYPCEIRGYGKIFKVIYEDDDDYGIFNRERG